MKLILLLVLMSFLFSQKDGNGHFIKTDESVDKNFKYYSPLMLNANAGYLFHQSVEIPEINYSDNVGFSIDADIYLVQGVYLLLSTTLSNTDVTYKTFTNDSSLLIDSHTDSYKYFSPSIGIKYYFRNSKEFNQPWFFSFGLGRNYFSGKHDFDRFSALFELGKLTNFKAGKTQLYFSLSAHMFEAKGYQQYYLDNGYVINDIDFKSYVSIKLNVGVHFDLINKLIRF